MDANTLASYLLAIIAVITGIGAIRSNRSGAYKDLSDVVSTLADQLHKEVENRKSLDEKFEKELAKRDSYIAYLLVWIKARLNTDQPLSLDEFFEQNKK